MQPTPQELARLKELALSPAGQALMQLLHQQGGDSLDQAMAQAAGGDYTQAKSTLSGLLASPEAQALLRQLGDSL